MRRLFFCLLSLVPSYLFAQTLEPTETETLLNVSVINDLKKPLEGEKVTFTSLSGNYSVQGTTGSNGKFSVLIHKGQKYNVRYSAYGVEKDRSTLDIPATEFLTFGYTITIKPAKVFTLDNVFFDSGKSTLRPESSKELNELAEYLLLKKSLVIEIAGHTDDVGTPESNQKLSEDRAGAVKEYLEKKGVEGSRVLAQGYGDLQPIADNSTPEGKQKNRRTEVRIISE